MVYRKNENIVARKSGNEYILVPVSGDIANMEEVYTLNEMGGFIFDLIDGIIDSELIIETVASNFQVDTEIAKKEITEYILELSRNNIITN
ncbi:MAG: PqqD family protein [Bacteroidetes bacterium]|nr:PqqD family protein [Bacteroidota bacterium]MBU1718561.1 PqqD family protein [Bacteroidota bacterium]